MNNENIKCEGLWRVTVTRSYEAVIEVCASSKHEAERYAQSDENQHIANRNEDYFLRFHDIEHTHEAKLYESYEGDE